MKVRMLNTMWRFGPDRDSVHGFRCSLDFGQREGKHSRGSILVHRDTPTGQDFFEVVPKEGRRVVHYAGPDETMATHFLNQRVHTAKLEKTWLVSEGLFVVARGGGDKDVVLIKRGDDKSDRVLLFVGHRASDRTKVTVFKEETTGVILQECVASNEKESAAEVAVILQPGQTIAFRAKNDYHNSDMIFIYFWNGDVVGLEYERAWREWKAAKDMDQLVETGDLEEL